MPISRRHGKLYDPDISTCNDFIAANRIDPKAQEFNISE